MKIEKIEEGKRNEIYFENTLYRALTEANLNRVTKGHDTTGYAIISASRSGDNMKSEMGQDLSDEQVVDENNRRTFELSQKIKHLGYSYIPVLGGYQEQGAKNPSFEKSFVVYPYNVRKGTSADFEVFFNDMLKLGKEYNQDSILRKAPNEKAQYIDCSSGKPTMEFDGMTLNDVSQEYFTALKKWNPDKKYSHPFQGKPQRYTLEGLYAPVGGSIMECHRRTMCEELFFNPYDKEE